MSTVFVDATQIVIEMGLYRSIYAVHRAAQKGEIPPGRLYGKRMLWRRQAILDAHDAPKPLVIKRRKNGAARRGNV